MIPLMARRKESGDSCLGEEGRRVAILSWWGWRGVIPLMVRREERLVPLKMRGGVMPHMAKLCWHAFELCQRGTSGLQRLKAEPHRRQTLAVFPEAG